MSYDITLISTADWDNPFWTNKQHVAVELARRGHRVLYIDSLGLRAPTASAQDLRRMWKRLIKALRPPRRVRDGLWVWSPIVIPFQRFAIVRLINRNLLGAGLLFWSFLLQLKPMLLWTYNPMTTTLLSLARFKTVAYHCVDAIESQPGMPSDEIRWAERQLLQVSDVCFATSESLFENCMEFNANSHYLPNVADYGHFSEARLESTDIPADIAAIKRPIIGFIGAISGYKVDFSLLRQIAELRADWSIVLIGKIGEGEPLTNTEELHNFPNVIFLGPRAYKMLPAYLKAFDVAILPSMRNDYTRGMFPMKFFEYLAAGCPVVSTELPALRSYSGVACLAEGREAFMEGIEDALRGKCAPLDARLSAAKEQTYEKRTEKMLSILGAGRRAKMRTHE